MLLDVKNNTEIIHDDKEINLKEDMMAASSSVGPGGFSPEWQKMLEDANDTHNSESPCKGLTDEFDIEEAKNELEQRFPIPNLTAEQIQARHEAAIKKFKEKMAKQEAQMEKLDEERREHLKLLDRIRQAPQSLPIGDYSCKIPPAFIEEITQFAKDLNRKFKRIAQDLIGLIDQHNTKIQIITSHYASLAELNKQIEELKNVETDANGDVEQLERIRGQIAEVEAEREAVNQTIVQIQAERTVIVEQIDARKSDIESLHDYLKLIPDGDYPLKPLYAEFLQKYSLYEQYQESPVGEEVN
jgi:archaellum component FlaC